MDPAVADCGNTRQTCAVNTRTGGDGRPGNLSSRSVGAIVAQRSVGSEVDDAVCSGHPGLDGLLGDLPKFGFQPSFQLASRNARHSLRGPGFQPGSESGSRARGTNARAPRGFTQSRAAGSCGDAEPG